MKRIFSLVALGALSACAMAAQTTASGLTNAPTGVLLDGIACVDDIPIAGSCVVEQANDFLRRILQVVIHGDDVSAARMAQPGHHRVVFAEIACVLDISQRHRRGAQE